MSRLFCNLYRARGAFESRWSPFDEAIPPAFSSFWTTSKPFSQWTLLMFSLHYGFNALYLYPSLMIMKSPIWLQWKSKHGYKYTQCMARPYNDVIQKIHNLSMCHYIFSIFSKTKIQQLVRRTCRPIRMQLLIPWSPRKDPKGDFPLVAG